MFEKSHDKIRALGRGAARGKGKGPVCAKAAGAVAMEPRTPGQALSFPRPL